MLDPVPHFKVPRRRRTGIMGACVALALLSTSGCAVQVAETALSRGATSYWLWTENQKEQTVFATDIDRISLHVRFDYNFVASTQTFRVTWYEPSGNAYVAGGVTTIFGSNDSMIVNLKIAGTTASQKPGRWRVTVHHGAKLLVSREFELVNP